MLQLLMLKPYIPGIELLIGQNIYYNNFSEIISNELHKWIEKYPHVIPYPNIPDRISVKVNVDLLKKQKNLPQISVGELRNNLFLPVS